MNNVSGQRRERPQGPRPSQDMNGQGGMAWGRNDQGQPNSSRGIPPLQSNTRMSANGKAALEGYKKDLMNGFEAEKPRYNPANTVRPQSSMLLNVNDAIQVHLLVETALGDSKEFELLSQEEVDDLKKQVQMLEQRIQQTRQNLAIQSKYRDAAMSMSKLYSPRSSAFGEKRSRLSMLGMKNGNSDQVDQADQEREASERKCQDLALELWNLEKRLMEPQRRLLQHTAGILQMTHRGPVNVTKQDGTDGRGLPGSPESLYTYNNARNSFSALAAGDIFDERSLYRSFDRLDGFGVVGPSDNQEASGSNPAESALIMRTEQKLESLNTRLREVIVKANPELNSSYTQPPGKDSSGPNFAPGVLLSSHLEFLEQGLQVIDAGQELAAEEKARIFEQRRNADFEMEETVEKLNHEVRTLLLSFDASRPNPPRVTGQGLPEQIEYFKKSIAVIEDELQRVSLAHTELAEANSVNDRAAASQSEQIETILMGLWDIIQSGEEDIRQRKLQRRQARSTNGGAAADDDSDNDLFDPVAEPFSVSAFSAKVQWLFGEATGLKDQKKVLQRQIKQQRELNNKDTGELTTKLEQTEEALKKTESDADNLQERLMTVMADLDDARHASRQRGIDDAEAESAAIADLRQKLAISAGSVAQLEARLATGDKAIADLDAELQELRNRDSSGESQSRLFEAQSKVELITAQSAAAEAAKATEHTELQKQISTKEEEIEVMNMEIANLRTEVTIARAELDGAYGTRAQRAAEVAKNPVIQRELDELSTRNKVLTDELNILRAKSASSAVVDKLKQELSETISEYELMTKASIDWEKERESLEREIDRMRDERENLEARLSDEQVLRLGLKSPGAVSSAGSPGLGPGEKSSLANLTSTMVMRNEFKKMMRDARAEGAKALRTEQAERRRVEEELRALKKANGPRKSGLSQSSGP